MIDFSAIQSEKIRGLLKSSLKFQLLPKEKQSALLSRIVRFSKKQQEKIYLSFLQKESEAESPIKVAREAAFKTLLEKMQQANRVIKNMASREIEHGAQEEEKSKEENLLSELKNL
jgi:acetate kinase